jgi:hypothetical protein
VSQCGGSLWLFYEFLLKRKAPTNNYREIRIIGHIICYVNQVKSYSNRDQKQSSFSREILFVVTNWIITTNRVTERWDFQFKLNDWLGFEIANLKCDWIGK